MTYFKGRYYLFYAGNSYLPGTFNSSPYATGYAICPKGPAGGCYRPTSKPLLASNEEVQGPAGGSAFIDQASRLRFAYSYYWAGETRQPAPRRLKVATLEANSSGTLAVRSRG